MKLFRSIGILLLFEETRQKSGMYKTHGIYHGINHGINDQRPQLVLNHQQPRITPTKNHHENPPTSQPFEANGRDSELTAPNLFLATRAETRRFWKDGFVDGLRVLFVQQCCGAAKVLEARKSQLQRFWWCFRTSAVINSVAWDLCVYAGVLKRCFHTRSSRFRIHCFSHPTFCQSGTCSKMAITIDMLHCCLGGSHRGNESFEFMNAKIQPTWEPPNLLKTYNSTDSSIISHWKLSILLGCSWCQLPYLFRSLHLCHCTGMIC